MATTWTCCATRSTVSSTLTPAEFATKWAGSTTTERAASQEHFIDLCRMIGVPTPHDADPTGDRYAFEKGAGKSAGGDGFADVWKRGHFAWEYKGKRKDLKAAYQQLLQYREALDNPPLLVVCDLNRFEVHTNFTNTPATVHAFTLQDLLEHPQEPLRVLRAVMEHPEELRPGKTRDELTAEAAQQFASLAERLRARGHEPHAVARWSFRVCSWSRREASPSLSGGQPAPFRASVTTPGSFGPPHRLHLSPATPRIAPQSHQEHHRK